MYHFCNVTSFCIKGNVRILFVKHSSTQWDNVLIERNCSPIDWQFLITGHLRKWNVQVFFFSPVTKRKLFPFPVMRLHQLQTSYAKHLQCNAVHCTAAKYIVLHCSKRLYCNAAKFSVMHRKALHFIIVCCTATKSTALCSIALHCTTPHCSQGQKTQNRHDKFTTAKIGCYM